MGKDYLKVSEDLLTEQQQLQENLVNEGIPALKARMEAEGIKILYVADYHWRSITEDEYMARVIVIEDNDLYVYGSAWEDCGDGPEPDSWVYKAEELSSTSVLINLVPKLIASDFFYEDSKQRPQDIDGMRSFFGGDDDGWGDDEEDDDED